MPYEGDLSLLSQLARGEGRIGLLVLPGFMRGVDGSARASAFEARGLVNNFTVLVGVSTGAPVVLYAAGGCVTRGTEIYYKECTTERFLSWSFRRFLKGTSADMGYQAALYRGHEGSNPADLDAAKKFPGDIYVAVTDFETGIGILVDAKAATPDMVEAVHASIAVPVIYRNEVYYGEGRRGVDGAIGLPFPAELVIEEYGLDGLIVLANRPSEERIFWWSTCEFLYSLMLHSRLRRALRRTRFIFVENLGYLRRQAVHGKTKHLIFWSEESVSVLMRDAERLKAIADTAYRETLDLIDRAGV